MVPLRRGGLSSLFAPAYIPGDQQSVDDVAAWQAGRVGMWPKSQIDQYRVPTATSGVATGQPGTSMVDPTLLQAAAQNQPYTPTSNVVQVSPDAPAPGAPINLSDFSGGARVAAPALAAAVPGPELGRSVGGFTRDEIAQAILTAQHPSQQSQYDTARGVSDASGGGTY